MQTNEIGTIPIGEHHPAADSALEYIKSLPVDTLLRHQESFASCALADNKLAECCSETLRRLLNGEPVSDRYLLGLAWTMKETEDYENT